MKKIDISVPNTSNNLNNWDNSLYSKSLSLKGSRIFHNAEF